MQLPFTAEQFYGVFRDYNTTLWPVQMLLAVVAVVGLVLIARARSKAARAPSPTPEQANAMP